MKKIIILFGGLILTASVFAQQRPEYTQYVQNYFLINPAAAGIEKDINITTSFRKQWAGLNGSPATSYLTFNTPLRNKKTGMDITSAKDYRVLYSPAEPHHALGFTIINDEAGALNRFVAYATYAYHLQLSSKVNLSAGISGGISTINVRPSKLSLETIVDPAVYNYTGKPRADVNAGMAIYGEQFFAGISLQQIVPSKVRTSGNQINLYGDRKFPDLFVSGGYRFEVNEDISIIPTVMLKYINNIPVTFDVNTKFDYKDLVWVGASYRYRSGMAAFAGVRLPDEIKFGYSYDLTTSGLQKVSSGTHEFWLAFTLKRNPNAIDRYGIIEKIK